MTQTNTVGTPNDPATTTVPPTPAVSYQSNVLETEPNPQARQWGMFAHLSALVGMVIPFGSVIGPLVVWQMKKAEYPFVEDQGKEALNFQITVAIALIACMILMFVLIGFVLMPLVGITALVFTIIAGIKANGGVRYRYPFALRLIK